jgi:sterol desaturase/sphingolipid hydroxylase (fatty acid hydroxylase superfamily)
MSELLLSLGDYYGALLLLPFLLLDLVHRARTYDATRHWRLRALAVSAAAYGSALVAGRLWFSVLPQTSLFEGAALGTLGGAAVGVLVYEFGHYWYHRAAHAWDWLWRAGHQMHHAAESLDAYGAFYQHPVDAALFTGIAVIVFVPVLGLAPEAAALASAFLYFNAAFQHANIATPRWLGFVVQRPESHAVHHAQAVHHYNFSDLPLWDMLFGTFVNPDKADAPVGFWKGASSEIWGLLSFQAVWRSPTANEAKRQASQRGLFQASNAGLAALLVLAIIATPFVAHAEPVAPNDEAVELDPIQIDGQQQLRIAYRTVMAGLDRARSDDPADKDLVVCVRHAPLGTRQVRIECMTNEGWEAERLRSLRDVLGLMKSGVGRYPAQLQPRYAFNPTQLARLGRALGED